LDPGEDPSCRDEKHKREFKDWTYIPKLPTSPDDGFWAMPGSYPSGEDYQRGEIPTT
jgi:hypothetical protein